MEFAAHPASRWVLYLLLGLGLVGALVGGSVLLLPPRLAYTVAHAWVEVDAGVSFFDQSFEIPRAKIEEVRPVALNGGRKLRGSNGFGFCTGRWTYPDLGAVTQATTCGDAGVLVVAGGARFVVAPAEQQSFLAAVAPGSAPGAPRTFQPVPMSPMDRWMRLLVGLPTVLIVLVLVRVLLRPIRYRFEDGLLVVPAHFSPVRVPVRGARVRRGELRGIRLGGSATPGLYLGRFRDGQGGYHAAATIRDGVWIESGRRVFVSPADPDAFLVALVANGAILAE